MSKKLTYNFIKEQFKNEGYTLLSTEYKNSKTKLKVRCDKGHEYEVFWGHWNTSKSRCPYCRGVAKYSLKQVKNVFKSLGYTLLSKVYVNANVKLKYVCDKGHVNKISFYSINHGHRCPDCMNNKKLDINFIRITLNKEGYALLTKKYINNKQKLVCLCNKNHKCKIRFDSWLAGRRCPTCKGIKQSINRSGAGHPNWKGGISKEPYCNDWTKEYKEFIKERDGNRCLNPYCNSKNPADLTIHHIDYNKKNCQPNNLITVCRSCNSRANTDRNWHTGWYQAIIYRRYGNNA